MCRRCSTCAKIDKYILLLFQLINNIKKANQYLSYSLNNTVISIGAFMGAGKSFKSWVFNDFESNTVLRSKLLKLSHDTVCNVGYTFKKNNLG